jgi:hypothetical protein
MTKTQNGRFLAALCGGLLLAGAAWLPGAVCGDEPPANCPKCSAVEKGIPVLSKLPYVNRLFKNVTATKYQECQDVARIGVDFDVEACQECPPPAPAASKAGPIVARWFVVEGGNKSACQATICESDCGSDDCQTLASKVKGYCEVAPCCDSACRKAAAGSSWERIIDLTARNAALEASLEAQTAFQKEKSDLFEMLAEMAAHKAKLETQVEALAQQNQVTKEMLTLMTENARLKAQVEGAEAKLAIVHEMAKLAMENEQLKLALQKRQNHGLISGDVQYFPPSPETRSSPVVPTRATLEDSDPQPLPQRPSLER